MSDAIAIASPNGRMSKRAKDAAIKRLGLALFGTGSEMFTHEPTPDEARASDVLRLRRSAANLRDLAARGMSTRKFTREADRLEAEAAALEQVVQR